MRKGYIVEFIVLFFLIISIFGQNSAASEFQYPYYLLDSHIPGTTCWYGIDANGTYPVAVDPNKYLVGPPPSIQDSAVSLPVNSWVELLFRGVIVDGPGVDLYISEMDPAGEKALVFLTNGAGQEYLLALAEVPNTNLHQPTTLEFDLAGKVLPFEPRTVRVVGIDLKGESPGFDLSYIKARIAQNVNETASYPYPPDKAEDVPFDMVLNWVPGQFGDNYNLYFGKDISCIYPDADPVLKFISDISVPDSNSFDPNGLEMGKTYYWRIDEVNQNDPNSTLTGAPWRFTVSNHFVLDNFDSYNSENLLGNTWMVENHGYVRLVSAPDPVHSCLHAMEIGYNYNNTQKTVATYNFEKPQNWISAGVKSIDLYFYGYENNYPGSLMDIMLNDGNDVVKIPYNGDMNDISQETWQLWRINLQSLGLLSDNQEQIDLSHIQSFSIVFEKDPNSYQTYGYGTIYFDDVIFYSSRCLDEDRPEADFNGDCFVDFHDFAELAYNWLESGYNIYQVQKPESDPIFWYQFENDTIDTIGNAHGDIQGNLTYVPGVYGQAIKFDGGSNWIKVAPVAYVFSHVTRGLTIAFWQKGEDSPYNKRATLFCSEYEYNISDPAISINLGCWNGTGIYNWDCGTHQPFDRRLTGKHRYKKEWSNQWNHWAFTKDSSTGIMEIYLNGVLLNSRTDSSNTISLIDSFTIGTGWYGTYNGLMDDMRIYDYALSQPEIAYIATNGTGIFDVNLMTPADLNPDNVIDYKDLLILADSWLENDLFPK